MVVWESTANRALGGRAAQPAQQAAINAYLDGAASVLGRARVGLYGGYGPVSGAFRRREDRVRVADLRVVRRPVGCQGASAAVLQ